MNAPSDATFSLSKRGIDCDFDYVRRTATDSGITETVQSFSSQFTPSICIDNRLNFVTDDITNNVNHCMQIPNRQSQSRKPRRTITKQHVYGGGGVGGGGGCGTFWSL